MAVYGLLVRAATLLLLALSTPGTTVRVAVPVLSARAYTVSRRVLGRTVT